MGLFERVQRRLELVRPMDRYRQNDVSRSEKLARALIETNRPSDAQVRSQIEPGFERDHYAEQLACAFDGPAPRPNVRTDMVPIAKKVVELADESGWAGPKNCESSPTSWLRIIRSDSFGLTATVARPLVGVAF